MSVNTINIPILTSDILFNLLGVNDISLSYLSRSVITKKLTSIIINLLLNTAMLKGNFN